MTHDELVIRIIKLSEYDNENWKFYPALRKVVELHKPVEQTTGIAHTQENGLEVLATESLCSYCSKSFNDYDKVFYPCQTIKIIEEQLK